MMVPLTIPVSLAVRFRRLREVLWSQTSFAAQLRLRPLEIKTVQSMTIDLRRSPRSATAPLQRMNPLDRANYHCRGVAAVPDVARDRLSAIFVLFFRTGGGPKRSRPTSNANERRRRVLRSGGVR
jgi:hypothetical protein